METVDLNDTLDQMDLIHIFRAFNPETAEYTYLYFVVYNVHFYAQIFKGKVRVQIIHG